MLWPAMVRVVDTVRAVDTARVDTMDLRVDLQVDLQVDHRAAMSDRCVACTITFMRILRPSMPGTQRDGIRATAARAVTDPPDLTASAAMDPRAEDPQGAATTVAVRPAVVPPAAATTAAAIPAITVAVPQAVVRPVAAIQVVPPAAATAARATTFRPMSTGQPKVATPFR